MKINRLFSYETRKAKKMEANRARERRTINKMKWNNTMQTRRQKQYFIYDLSTAKQRTFRQKTSFFPQSFCAKIQKWVKDSSIDVRFNIFGHLRNWRRRRCAKDMDFFLFYVLNHNQNKRSNRQGIAWHTLCMQESLLCCTSRKRMK